MKIHEPLVIYLEGRAASWVSPAGSPGAELYLRQGCLAAEPLRQTRQAPQRSCESDMRVSSTSLRIMGCFRWCDPGVPYICPASQPPHTGEEPEPSGSHHLQVSGFSGFVFCSNSQLPATINENKSNMQVE